MLRFSLFWIILIILFCTPFVLISLRSDSSSKHQAKSKQSNLPDGLINSKVQSISMFDRKSKSRVRYISEADSVSTSQSSLSKTIDMTNDNLANIQQNDFWDIKIQKFLSSELKLSNVEIEEYNNLKDQYAKDLQHGLEDYVDSLKEKGSDNIEIDKFSYSVITSEYDNSWELDISDKYYEEWRMIIGEDKFYSYMTFLEEHNNQIENQDDHFSQKIRF